MPNPYDYSLDFSPIQMGLQSIQQGNIQRRQQEQEDARLKVLQQQQQREIAIQERNQAFQEYQTSDEYNPEEAVKMYPDKLGEVQEYEKYRTGLRESGGQDFSRRAFDAAKRGDKEGLFQILDSNADFINNSGDRELSVDKLKREYEEDPEGFQDLAADVFVQSGGKRADLVGKIQKKGKDGRTSTIKDFEYYKDLKKTDPEAAKQFGIDAGLVSRQGIDLSSHLQKRLSESSDAAVESRNNAGRFRVLSEDFEKADVGGGLFQGSWGEKIKELSGTQDAVTSLRKRYNSVRASQVVANLPPGAASDTDIALALSGWPGDNATGEQISSFMNGLAKLEDFNSEFNAFKADYISNEGHERNLLRVWEEKQLTDANVVNLSDEELMRGL